MFLHGRQQEIASKHSLGDSGIEWHSAQIRCLVDCQGHRVTEGIREGQPQEWGNLEERLTELVQRGSSVV